MAVRCEKCGHENDPKFLFCGMCGERLPTVKWLEAVPLDEEPISESVPSDPRAVSDDVDPDRVAYLLEDEEEQKGHTRRLYLALLFLIVALALLAMHWRQYAHRWLSDYVARSAVVSPSVQSPEDDRNSPEQSTPTPATESHRTPAAQTPSQPDGVQSQTALPSQTAATSAVDSSASNLPIRSTPLPRMPEPAITKPLSKAHAKSQRSSPPETPPLGNSGDNLASDGEKYLYGNGVAEDCSIARRKLAMAAERQNPHALTLLGTMSATGHCAPRDLPTAYQWFAKALHADPGNRRLDQDLNSIWQQMTPGERQSALKGR
jgi:hypothetical protein